MIDRLEELLLAVEEQEEENKALTIPHEIRQGKTLVTPYDTEDTTELDPAGTPSAGEESLPGGRSGEREVGGIFLCSRLTAERASALAALYRQVSREPSLRGTDRPASVAVIREVSAPSAPGLTAGELDLAMRRDSRRYDGGMTIY